MNCLRFAAFPVAILFAMSVSLPVTAQDQHQDLGAVGAKLANPVSDVWALFTEFDFSFSDGSLNNGDWKFGSTMEFQPVMPIKLTDNWKLITRPTIPVVWSAQVPEPDGLGGVDFDGKFGLGDITLPLVLAPNKGIDLGGGQLILSLGPTWSFPTSTPMCSARRSGRWGPPRSSSGRTRR